jgi:hypothetical protein
MKFALLNFLSNEDLSISYESWDVQLTFDTLINAFRFKALPLGGTKVENVCFTKLAEFRKTSAISSIFIKTFWIFFWWKIWQIGFFFYKLKAFEMILFWLGCDVWKMDDLFQRPLGSLSIILNFSKKFLVKADIKQLSPKIFLRSFDENWRNTSLICIQRALLAPPPPHPLGLKGLYVTGYVNYKLAYKLRISTGWK